MKYLKLIPLAIAVLSFSACGTTAEKDAGANKTTAVAGETASTATPEMVDGVQVVKVSVDDMGYTPSRIQFKQGVPARIVFDQHGKHECSSQVQSPTLGIATTDLPAGKQTAVEFTPERAGEFTFTCGMEMLSGTIIVGS